MKTRTRIRFDGGWAATAAALLLSAATAAAQTSPDLGEFTARSITRLALLDIRLAPTPTPEDYRIASLLLGMAQGIAPEDQEIIRRRMEAAWQAGDTDTVIELSRTIVKLDPHDTVALLRVITAQVARLQNVEDRLAMYDRFLDPRGDGRHIDPSIRSRLALDAALLLRDRGDEDGFVERLILATQLDSTHKEAALVALSYASDRVGVIDRLDLMANVLLADPVDPNVHEAIARQLAIGGAYVGARRFLDNARTIRRAAGQPVESVDHAERMRRWHADGPSAVIDEINRTLLLQKEEVARDFRELVARGLPVDQARRPEEIRISPHFGTIAALAFDAQGDRAAVEAAIAELAVTVTALATPLSPENRPPDIAPEQADRQLAELLVTLQTARFWTGTQTEAGALAFLPESPLIRAAPPDLPVLQAWLKLRRGQAAEAAQALEELADSSLLARVAFAQACEQLGDVPEALEQYDLLVRDAPLDIHGAWARSRLTRLGVAIDPAQTERLERWARPERSAGVPGWVDETARSPRAFINLRTDLERNLLDAVERATLRVSITNQREIPLALGPDRTINSRLLLAPKLDAPLGALAQLSRPEVVDLDRRLRLMPRETLEVEVWPDPGETGLLLEMLALRTVRVRWRVIQGFWLSAAGGYEPGPMSLTTETPSLVRTSLPEASLNAGELARKVEADPEHLLPRAASALRTLLLMIGPQDNEAAPRRNDEAVRQVAAAWIARWPNLSPQARAMAAAVIPGRIFAEPLSALDDRIKADEDPVVLAVAMVTRVTDPGDEFLARMERSTDPRVAELARLVGARLAAGANGYAHLSPARLWPDAEPPAP